MSTNVFCGLMILVTALPAAGLLGDEPKGTPLFDGKSLSGWSHVSGKEGTPIGDVWSVQDGLLVCTGDPRGYLRTDKSYRDYELVLDWRWPEGTPGGNNGVLVHTSTPGALGVWPKSIEVQLGKGDAGDFWVIGTELKVENLEARRKGRRHLNLTDDSEKELGQWNQMKIVCRGDTIRVWVNDELVNEATDCNVSEGAICLQSEGAQIHFRGIMLTPLTAASAGKREQSIPIP